MLIDEEQDTRELLRAEDQAILTTEHPPTPERTRLDELMEMLSDDRTAPVHETPEG